MSIWLGTAGWTLPRHLKDQLPTEGSHLHRYSRLLNAVEINSSFYREHRAETYARWAATTPDNFRFSVKLSRFFTHEQRLNTDGSRLRDIISGIRALGDKFSVLLIQLPPSLDFQASVAAHFFSQIRELFHGSVAFEPRHMTWASSSATQLMREFRISRVLADPEVCPMGDAVSDQATIRYWRLHGSPEIYRSRYSPEFIVKLAQNGTASTEDSWFIFDNTTFGFAFENARELQLKFQSAPALQMPFNEASYLP